MWCFFENHKIPYNWRCGSVVNLPVTNTTKCGKNSINFRGTILWNVIPKNIKLFKTLLEFKKEKVEKHLIPCNCAACRF